jgi:hypothetical protein
MLIEARKTQKHKGAKAQRKPANNEHSMSAFFVPWRLCVFVFTNPGRVVLNGQFLRRGR